MVSSACHQNVRKHYKNKSHPTNNPHCIYLILSNTPRRLFCFLASSQRASSINLSLSWALKEVKWVSIFSSKCAFALCFLRNLTSFSRLKQLQAHTTSQLNLLHPAPHCSSHRFQMAVLYVLKVDSPTASFGVAGRLSDVASPILVFTSS